ncbi:MAG TPA: membrane protein insertion efficiency factor YidD [Burkholderiaceae bacterium]|nr:membrane protein insertion efficiency factor YidD [Burkholderiaceae bacterium]
MPESLLSTLLLRLIEAYRYLLSPWVGNSCRYWPTCSEYAQEAIEQHGAARGTYLAARRLARCHPYGRGGVDPVPAVFSWRCRCAEPPATGAAGMARDA